MNRIKFYWLILAIGLCARTTYATPAGEDQIWIDLGTTHKVGESIYSITAQWRIDGGLKYESTGLTFSNGPDTERPDDGPSLAKKLVSALNEGMIKQYPSWRGVNVHQGGKNNRLIMENKKGFAFTRFTLRDFTNQKFTVGTHQSSFAAAQLQFSLDFVDANSVNFTPMFAGAAVKTADFRAAGGGITITAGKKKTVTIDTANKSLSEIEREIATQLSGFSAHASTTSLVPDTTDRDARNIKPFDGGEVQFPGYSQETLTVEIADQSIGLISKYKFKFADEDVNTTNPFIVAAGVLAVFGMIGYYVLWPIWVEWRDKRKNGNPPA